MPLLTSSLLTAWAVGYESFWSDLSLGGWLLVTLALSLTSALALTPPTFLALVYGYFLGWTGLPLLFLLNLGAIGLVYLIGKKLIPLSFLAQLQQAYPAAATLLLRFHENPIRLIFFTKLSPMLPFAITNLVFTMAGARLPQMLLGGTLGMIPRTALAMWIGTQAKEIRYLLDHPNEGIGAKLLIIALVLLSTVGIGWFFRKR
ncbi:VTT domain-containing protein [Salmonirosea aquatica]|uniref:TVP38/TMEM64 family membrane protein n=1 Tax=Salmonirosea aquatica TaxID=2654236 RepID=A0A7C9FD70_9BACT|nr:hypothetical protein [Cytophagaceae bacterium SJW1-29]